MSAFCRFVVIKTIFHAARDPELQTIGTASLVIGLIVPATMLRLLVL
jgi:hypothetical protein